jgi:hypothetical protein
MHEVDVYELHPSANSQTLTCNWHTPVTVLKSKYIYANTWVVGISENMNTIISIYCYCTNRVWKGRASYSDSYVDISRFLGYKPLTLKVSSEISHAIPSKQYAEWDADGSMRPLAFTWNGFWTWNRILLNIGYFIFVLLVFGARMPFYKVTGKLPCDSHVLVMVKRPACIHWLRNWMTGCWPTQWPVVRCIHTRCTNILRHSKQWL